MNCILSFFFPVRLPKLTQETDTIPGEASADPYHAPVTEDGVLWRAYDVRRTGIEKWRASRENYDRQMASAQRIVTEQEEYLIAQGYVNTIHDCWEKPK